MLFNVEPMPGDPILALMAAYRADSSPDKVDLGVGVYQDDAGNTPVLQAVSDAEARLLAAQQTKSYVGIAGNEQFNSAMTTLAFGADHATVRDGRVTTVQTAGGSGGLRVAGELLATLRPDATLWVTTPTWPNHRPLLEAAGLRIAELRYYDATRGALDAEGFVEDLERIAPGDVLLLHGCCHNPTGEDLPFALWQTVARVCAERGILPFVDSAYQGFAESLDADAAGIRHLAEVVPEMISVASCSKNFGLYRERTGALSLVADSAARASAVRTHLMRIVRAMISMPPDHGAAIVATILGDSGLTEAWLSELEAMRVRMKAQREGFVTALGARGHAERFAFVSGQNGMFSLLGIDRNTIDRLREEWHVYIVGSSRINVAGLTAGKVDYIAEALAATLAA